MVNFLCDNSCWYVLCVKTNCERKVKNDLEAIIASRNLYGEISQVCVPERENYVMKRGKNCLEKSLVYPGYVYVRMRMTGNNWYIVRNITNVFGFVEAEKGQPLPLSEKDAARIEAYIERPEHISYKEGDRVSVKSGPWENTVGVITGINENDGKVTLSVEMFMRTVSIELPLGNIAAA